MVELTVSGMHCGPCARAVTDAVRSIDPAAGVEIGLDTKAVSVETDAEIGLIQAAIEGAGYQVELGA